MTRTIALLLTAFVALQLDNGNKILLNCAHLKLVGVTRKGETFISINMYSDFDDVFTANVNDAYTYPDLVKIVKEQCHE